MFNQRAKRPGCICDLLSYIFGRVEMKAENSQYKHLLSEWNFTIVPGDLLVMFVMCCYCDLGKKNATAGLYFQRIFLKHQLMQSNVVQGNLTFYLHFWGLGRVCLLLLAPVI